MLKVKKLEQKVKKQKSFSFVNDMVIKLYKLYCGPQIRSLKEKKYLLN